MAAPLNGLSIGNHTPLYLAGLYIEYAESGPLNFSLQYAAKCITNREEYSYSSLT